MKKELRLLLMLGVFLSICACSVDDIPELDFKPIDHYVYDGAIRDFVWDENVDGFWPVENYRYGFDKNPDGNNREELDKYVYVSVSSKEDLSSFKMFIPKLSSDLYSSYVLKHEDTGKLTAIQNGIETSLPSGKYQLYGVDYNGEYVAIDRHIQVIVLTPMPKRIMYVELNGSGIEDLNYKDGLFMIDSVKKAFSKVYGAAVLEGDFLVKLPEDVGLVSGVNYPVNMMDAVGYNPLDTAIMAIMRKINASYDEDYLHVIIAVNKLKKYWPLKIANDEYSFSLGNAYSPSEEPVNVNYFIGVSDDCGGGAVQQVSLKVDISNKLYRAYDHYGKPISINACNYLFTENGYPVVPHQMTAAAINHPLVSEKKLLGGIAWVPYSNMGRGSLYTMMHELGHSFGLADVITSYNETSYVYDAYGRYVGYVADGASTVESNLMAWRSPSGSKIRVRPQQVVCTGGSHYYSGNNRESPFWGSVETPIPELYDSQFGCLRGVCSWDNDNYWLDTNRRKYWRFGNEKSFCDSIDVFRTTKSAYDEAVRIRKEKKEKNTLD